MKVRFSLDSGAGIKSENKSEWLDTVDDLGLDPGEWENMDDIPRHEVQKEYWYGYGMPEYKYEENQ